MPLVSNLNRLHYCVCYCSLAVIFVAMTLMLNRILWCQQSVFTKTVALKRNQIVIYSCSVVAVWRSTTLTDCFVQMVSTFVSALTSNHPMMMQWLVSFTTVRFAGSTDSRLELPLVFLIKSSELSKEILLYVCEWWIGYYFHHFSIFLFRFCRSTKR